MHLPKSDDEILRLAGYWLMQTVENITGDRASESLFRACNAISSLRYEGDEGSGKMIVAAQDHPNVDIVISFKRVVDLNNYRGIRKLLEITSDNIHLLCDSDGIYGVGTLNALPYDENTQSLFLIEFVSHHTWLLQHYPKYELMMVEYGLPRLPSKPIGEDVFENTVKNRFPQIDTQSTAHLWSLANKASKQKHGTMIVVSDQAPQEAERLKNQSTPIESIQLTPDLILSLSSIDGALLIFSFR